MSALNRRAFLGTGVAACAGMAGGMPSEVPPSVGIHLLFYRGPHGVCLDYAVPQDWHAEKANYEKPETERRLRIHLWNAEWEVDVVLYWSTSIDDASGDGEVVMFAEHKPTGSRITRLLKPTDRDTLITV